MEQTIKFELNKDEAAQLSAMLDQCIAMLRESNERGERKQAEIARLSAETRVLLKQIGEKLNVETGF
ncbi:MAG: hypothetical protein ABI977_04375 [Acidobacteriota bacterium]